MKQVILMMVDTQRKDMLSCYNPSAPETQCWDSLAADGTLYENAYTCQPVCGPARSALFTGLYPHSNGMVANGMQLGANVKTAGQWLTTYNVECGYIGKWHLDGGDYFGYGKCPDGYNPGYWYDMHNFLDELPSDAARVKSRRNMLLRLDNPDEKDTFAHRCADRAIKFLNEFADKDFYLTLSLDEPHDPSVCPRRFGKLLSTQKYRLKKYPNTGCPLTGKPEHHTIYAKKFKSMRFFMANVYSKGLAACNLFCDYEMRRVLDEVKRLNLDPMIIYTSDHGEMIYSHGLMGKGCVMYNETVNVPLIIKGGGFKRGVSETPVSHIDILPTVMTYFGVPVPKSLQGEPLQNVKETPTRDVFIEYTRYEVDHDGFMGYQPARCIFDGRYKLVINLLTSDELYDCKTDPYELTNLIDDEKTAKIRNGLHDRLLAKMDETRDVYRGYYWGRRAWRSNYPATFDDHGMTRQQVEDDFVQRDYSTGLPMKGSVRKKIKPASDLPFGD